jgi:ParB-like nuclease domain
MSTEQQVALSRIVILPDVQVRLGLDEDLVRQYQEVLDDLPPVIVYDTGQGPDLLELAEGMHRFEAAKRAGRAAIKAIIRQGTHDDVLDCADTANATHGKPLTRDERHRPVRRLYERHYHGGRGPHAKWDAGWSVERIGREMGYTPKSVKDIVHAVEVGKTDFEDPAPAGVPAEQTVTADEPPTKSVAAPEAEAIADSAPASDAQAEAEGAPQKQVPVQLKDRMPTVPKGSLREVVQDMAVVLLCMRRIEATLAQLGYETAAKRIRREHYGDWIQYHHEVTYHEDVLGTVLQEVLNHNRKAFTQAEDAYDAEVKAGGYAEPGDGEGAS